jgi:MFS family permease
MIPRVMLITGIDIVIGVQFIYVFVTVESALSIAPMFPLLGAEFKLNDTEVSLITGTCVIALGYANFIIVPCSNIFGRRFTCIIFGLLTIGTSIWEALATSYSSLIGARVLNGVATATNESLMVQVVADMFFLHERGQWTGLYL